MIQWLKSNIMGIFILLTIGAAIYGFIKWINLQKAELEAKVLETVTQKQFEKFKDSTNLVTTKMFTKMEILDSLIRYKEEKNTIVYQNLINNKNNYNKKTTNEKDSISYIIFGK